MITVRFPSGFSVQYNSAHFISGPDDSGVTRLYLSAEARKDGATPIARIPKECIVEFTQPCRTYNAAGSPESVEQELRLLRKRVESLTRKLAKK